MDFLKILDSVVGNLSIPCSFTLMGSMDNSTSLGVPNSSLNCGQFYNPTDGLSSISSHSEDQPITDLNLVSMSNTGSFFVVPSLISSLASCSVAKNQQFSHVPTSLPLVSSSTQFFNPIQVARLLALNQPNLSNQINSNLLPRQLDSFHSTTVESHNSKSKSRNASLTQTSGGSTSSKSSHNRNLSNWVSEWSNLRSSHFDRYSNSESINNRITQLEQANGDRSVQLILLQEINQVKTL